MSSDKISATNRPAKGAYTVIERSVPLYEFASPAESIPSYWAKFTDAERELIHSPETHYTGLAAARKSAIVRKSQAAS